MAKKDDCTRQTEQVVLLLTRVTKAKKDIIEMRRAEASGTTIEKAIKSGLAELGVTEDMVDVEVITKPSAFKLATVMVSLKRTDGEKVQEFLEGLLSSMGLVYAVEVISDTDDLVEIELIGNSGGSVIGYRGEVLNSIQYLASLIINNDRPTFKRVTVDAEGYREKRESILQTLALNLEKKVIRTKRSVKLEPMNPYERRIVHSTLQGSAYVLTKSEGEEPNRHIVILPKAAAITENSSKEDSSKRKKLTFAYRSDKKRRR